MQAGIAHLDAAALQLFCRLIHGGVLARGGDEIAAADGGEDRLVVRLAAGRREHELEAARGGDVRKERAAGVLHGAVRLEPRPVQGGRIMKFLAVKCERRAHRSRIGRGGRGIV